MNGIELWFLGQCGFRLMEPQQETIVFIDPFLSAHPNRTWQAPVGPADLAVADLVLCTHEHIDHFDAPAIEAALAVAGSRFTLVVPEPITGMALELGIPSERLIGARRGQEFSAAGMRVWPVSASHGIHVKDAYSSGAEYSQGLDRFMGYVIEMGGVRLYHAGDSIPFDRQVEQIKPLQVEIAMLPINGRDFIRESQDFVGNMDAREAAYLAHEMGARLLVPMHWELFPQNPGDPGELVRHVSENYPDLNVMVFGRSGKLIYQPVEPLK